MKILVTGSAGHLGEALMHTLLAEGRDAMGFHRNHGLPCLVLRTSRFFPEEDDHAETRQAYDDANAKANGFLHRRVDIEDVVSAHILALERGPAIGFGRYIISATTPFNQEDLIADIPTPRSHQTPGFDHRSIAPGTGFALARLERQA